MTVRLIDSLGTTEPLAAAFADEAVLGAMGRFEAALARAEARAGVIPARAADVIAACAVRGGFDAVAIARAARASGTIVISFVEMLTARVRAEDAAAATFVHWGATSQDVSDTALVLCLLDAARILEAEHTRLSSALRRIAEAHGSSVMLARTLLRPAAPTTFGLKAAGWLAAESRGYARLSAGFRDACVVQFGGAAGTLAALGADGPEVGSALATELNVPLPDAPWHAHRDRLAALVAACGIYAGTLGKMARDLSLLMQYEVAEAFEPGGGSSAMPHKRNPSASAIALAAANRLPGLVSTFLAGMVQEHERGLGGWHAEGGTVAASVQATGSALSALAGAMDALRIDPQRMRSNITATHGAIFAERALVLLAPVLGRQRAAEVIAAALDGGGAEGRTFPELLSQHPEVRAAIEPAILAGLDAPESYLGSAEHFRRRLIAGVEE